MGTIETRNICEVPELDKETDANVLVEKDGTLKRSGRLSYIASLVEQQAKNFQTNISDINARVNNIVANATVTDGNLELIDIRTDIDGNIHETAGEAVRGQVNQLSTLINDTKNVLDYSKETTVNATDFYTEKDKYVNNNGGIIAAAQWAMSEKIYVTRRYINVTYPSPRGKVIFAFFDKNDKYITRKEFQYNTGNEYEIPVNACYYYILQNYVTDWSGYTFVEYDKLRNVSLETKVESLDEKIEDNKAEVFYLKDLFQVMETTVDNYDFFPEKDQYITDSGTVKTSAAWAISDKYYVNTTHLQVICKNTSSTGINFFFYDNNNTFLMKKKFGTSTNEEILRIPDTAHYYYITDLCNNNFVRCTIKEFTQIEEVFKNKKSIVDLQSKTSDLPFANSRHRTHLIQNVLCVGDSLTEGSLGGVNTNLTEYNYPYFLSKETGWVTTNDGWCGARTTHYWNYIKNKTHRQWLEHYDAIIIFLGTNYGLTDTLDNDTAFDNYNDYPDTYTGAYCKIIEYFREKFPEAQIFLMGIPRMATANGINYSISTNVQKQVAEKYNLPLFDIYNDYDWQPEIIDNQLRTDGCHYNVVGYCELAHYIHKKIIEYISVNENCELFKFKN